MYAKTGEKDEESRPIKRTSEPRTENVGLPRDKKKKRAQHRVLNPELNPWTFSKLNIGGSTISRFCKLAI